ncbi:PhzF family phenazine biosynthesis protein [Sphingomonas morindae]|uniref:PhzF family phenazine biosynthesis protein n=1 Tax=Sphingomonas morindae TaxID=1541170 RepID=A0ABY4XEV4_9SPHN|nr:PhzF family phenazine biosynthesis protein [Sphingomonas morindae]USI75170.1 PhzF family phenazine biosynthesis protein [Sphingomonas morindae]
MAVMAGGGTADAARSGGRPYEVYDVFTDTPLSGNPVAVFTAPEGLSPEMMMAMTREINYSECTFVFPASKPGCDFEVRFFAMNSGAEIPIAGHPTIGTVFSLAERGLIAPGRRSIILQLGVGPTQIDLEWHEKRLAFAWMQQQPPKLDGVIDDRTAAAAAMGLKAEDLADLPIQQVSCGAPFLMVPVKTRATVDRAQLDRGAMGTLLDKAGLIRRGVLIFSLEPAGDDATAYSRMLGFGVTEDAATGNATGPLGAYLVTRGIVPLAQAGRMMSRQGVKMHRPSKLYISATEQGGRLSIKIGGRAVKAAEGRMLV